MEFSIKKINLEQQKSDCAIIGVFESLSFSPVLEQLNKLSDGYIKNLLLRGELKGKRGKTLLLYHIPNISFERILLVSCGKECEFDEYHYKQIIKETIKSLNNTATVEAICFLTELNVQECNSTYWKVRKMVETVKETLYRFDHLKTNKDVLCNHVKKIIINVSTEKEITDGETAIQHGLAIATGISVAKDLSNMPPNICNASYLASQANHLLDFCNKNITISVINEKEMNELGMRAYLAVGNGSQNESLMSIIKYIGNPNKEIRPIVLIGKGLTFDSGGISIKPAENMDEMKYDMCGAAAVYGVMHMITELKLPLNVIGILAGCENMPNGNSLHPGDIITTMSKQTVEVLNTDAEGRLVLCDVLTYVERFNPELVIDIATLTGACVIALGNHITGMISNNTSLANELLDASEQSGDLAWRLPLGIEFQKQIESNFADMANIGGRPGGVITAGCFLSRFTSKYNWAHLDIAGTAWKSGKEKGSTGRPVAMLSQFLLNRSSLKDIELL